MDPVQVDPPRTGPQPSRVDHRKDINRLSGSSDVVKPHSRTTNSANLRPAPNSRSVDPSVTHQTHRQTNAHLPLTFNNNTGQPMRTINKSDSRTDSARCTGSESTNTNKKRPSNAKDSNMSRPSSAGLSRNFAQAATSAPISAPTPNKHATRAQNQGGKNKPPKKPPASKKLGKSRSLSKGESSSGQDTVPSLKRRLPPGSSDDRSVKRKTEERRPDNRGILNESIPSDVPWGQIQMRGEPPFEFQAQVGQGTYGKVFRAIEKDTNCQFAMKRLRLESTKEGFPVSTAREMKILQSCAHPNIVRLREIVVVKSEIYMAMEYIENDLAGLLHNKNLEITRPHAKSLMKQILKGVAYLHHNRIIHRDIKGSNVLVTHNGTVKLADFGLAKTVRPEIPNIRYTNRVISLWYRPPELLLGSENYRYEVDMWSIGCLLVELFTRAPLFFATDEVSQIQAIYNVMGPAKIHDWPERETLPWTPLIDSYMLAHPEPTFRLNAIFSGPRITVACYDLATQLLQMNPSHRITADHALGHEYFQEEPRDERLDCAQNGEWHDWDAKRRLKEDN